MIRRLPAWSLAVFVATAGCASALSDANRPLPTYAGHAIEIFDDAIEPRAVGLDVDNGEDPRGDAILRERAQLSDAVLRVRVTTVTAKHDGANILFQLGLRTAEPLGGPFPPPEADFNITMGSRSPSVGLVRNLEDAIVGKNFIAFVRAFALPDGDRALHFHFAPDTKPEVAAVRAAMPKPN